MHVEVLLACPGQGSQRVGMLGPWTATACVRELMAAAEAVTDLPLGRLGTSDDVDPQDLNATEIAQPLTVLTSLASALAADLARMPAGPGGLLALVPGGRARDEASSAEADGGTRSTGADGGARSTGADGGARATGADGGARATRADGTGGVAVVGHSLGSLTALCLAGALTPAEAVGLAAERGRAMAEAAASTPGGMVALVGGDRDDVVAAIADAGLVLANVNGSRQVVAAGEPERIRALHVPRGTRGVALRVAGAFHSPAMAQAAPAVRAALAAVPERPLQEAFVDDVDGALHPAGTPGSHLLAALADKLTQPVRWDLVEGTARELEPHTIIELAPAGTLAGLVRRDLPGTRTLALRAQEDAPAARA